MRLRPVSMDRLGDRFSRSRRCGCLFRIVLFVLAIAGSNSAHAQGLAGGGGAASRSSPAFRRVERPLTVDFLHLRADLTLVPEQGLVKGVVRHTFKPKDIYLASLELDCGPGIKVSSIIAEPGDRPCRFQHSGERLFIDLDRPYSNDETVTLAITYEAKPENKGMTFVQPDPAYPDKPQYVWTQGQAEDHHFWIPVHDFVNDRFTSEMVITVPRPLAVLSNGKLIETRDAPDNHRTFHWKMDQDHVTYLLTVVAADFNIYRDLVGDLPVEYYVAKSVDEATARRFMGKTPKMIEFFNSYIGHKYPYAKYATVTAPGFGGGMENITATTMTDEPLIDAISALERDSDSLVAHELAHQWFGDWLTCKDWAHLWLNEGFASYFDPLFREHDRGVNDFQLNMRSIQGSARASDRLRSRPIVDPNYKTPDAMFDGITYSKGSAVLHMLRGLVGEQAWRKGISDYVEAHKGKLVETADFRKAMEQASGKDLGWFFDQWVFKPGHPSLKVSWRYEPDDRSVRVSVTQTQPVSKEAPAFRMPTTIELSYAEPDASTATIKSVPIVIDQANQEFVLIGFDAPQAVMIDPDGWLFADIAYDGKSPAEWLHLLRHGRTVLSRASASARVAGRAKEDAQARAALIEAIAREKCIPARVEMVEQLAQAGDSVRGTLLELARDPEAKIRVAAVNGLQRLGKHESTEKLFREVLNNSQEAYGARTRALRALVDWKVADAPALIDAALATRSDRDVLAANALSLALRETSDASRARALNAIKYGQSPAIRRTALQYLGRNAASDPEARKLLSALLDDPDRTLRFQAMQAVVSAKILEALPRLEARMEREAIGFSPMRSMLQNAIDSLRKSEKEKTAKQSESQAGGAAAADQEKAKPPSADQDQADRLNQQLRDLEEKLKALREEAAKLREPRSESKKE